MKCRNLILTIVVSTVLLISSQVFAAGQQAQQLNVEQVTEMQRLLNEHGYKVEIKDNAIGIVDENTMKAISKFQKAKGLAVTGQPNQDTLKALATSSDQQEFFGLAPELGEKVK